MGVAEWHGFKKRVEAKADHHGDRSSALMVVVMLVTVFDAAGKIIEHDLQEKPEQNKRAKRKGGVAGFACEDFRQQMQTSERHEIRAGERGDELDAAGFTELELERGKDAGEHGQNENGVNHSCLPANDLQ